MWISKVEALENKITQLRDLNTSITSSTTANNNSDNNNNAENTVESNSVDINELKNQIKQLNGKISEQSIIIQRLSSDNQNILSGKSVDQRDTEILNLRDQIDKIETGYKKDMEEKENLLTGMKSQLITSNENLKLLQKNISDLKKEKLDLQAELDKTQVIVNDCEIKVSELETQLTNKDKEINELENQIKNIQDENEQNTSILSEQEDTLKVKNEEFKDLKHSLNQYERTCNEMQSKIDQLTKMNNYHEEEIKKKENEIKDKNDKMNELYDSLNDETLRKKKLRDEYNQYIVKAEDEKSLLNDKIRTLEQQIIELTKANEILLQNNNIQTDNIKQLNLDLQSLRSKNETNDSDATNVFEKYTNLVKEKKIIENELHNFRQQIPYIKQIQKENESMKNVIKKFEVEVNNYQNLQNEYEQKLTELNDKVSELSYEEKQNKQEFYNELLDTRQQYEAALTKLQKEKEFYENRYTVLEKNFEDFSRNITTTEIASASNAPVGSLIIPSADSQTILSLLDQLCSYFDHEFVNPPLTSKNIIKTLREIAPFARSLVNK